MRWKAVRQVVAFFRDRRKWYDTDAKGLSDLVKMTPGTTIAAHALSYVDYKVAKARQLASDVERSGVNMMILLIFLTLIRPAPGPDWLTVLERGLHLGVATMTMIFFFFTQFVSVFIGRALTVYEEELEKSFRIALFRKAEQPKIEDTPGAAP